MDACFDQTEIAVHFQNIKSYLACLLGRWLGNAHLHYKFPYNQGKVLGVSNEFRNVCKSILAHEIHDISAMIYETEKQNWGGEKCSLKKVSVNLSLKGNNRFGTTSFCF